MLGVSGKRYFLRAIAADTNHLAAFPGLIELAIISSTPLEAEVMQEFEARSAGSKIHPAVAFTVAHLDRLNILGPPYFDDKQAERIFHALLSNSSLMQESRGHVLTANGKLSGRGGDHAGGKRRLLEEAVAVAPATFEFHLLYIESLFEVGDFVAAKEALARFEELDKYGYYKAEAAQFHDVLSALGRSDAAAECVLFSCRPFAKTVGKSAMRQGAEVASSITVANHSNGVESI